MDVGAGCGSTRNAAALLDGDANAARAMTYRISLSTDNLRNRAHALIKRAPRDWMVEIRERTRSDAQNAKLWAMLNDVALSKPGGRSHTPDTWKALFMQALGHEQLFEIGLDGRPFPLGFRSSKLTVPQMADLITFIQQWGDANGVAWSNEARE
jgi:hypothetical protein